jgi:amidase
MLTTAGNNNQKALEAARDCTMTQETLDRNLKALRDFAVSNARNLLGQYGVDVILGPCDSRTEASARRQGSQLRIFPRGLLTSTADPSLCT